MSISALQLAFQGLAPPLVAVQVALQGFVPLVAQEDIVGVTGGGKRQIIERPAPRAQYERPFAYVWRKPLEELKPAPAVLTAKRVELAKLIAELLPQPKVIEVKPEVGQIVAQVLVQQELLPTVQVLVRLDPELVRQWIAPVVKKSPVAQRPQPAAPSAHEAQPAKVVPKERVLSKHGQAADVDAVVDTALAVITSVVAAPDEATALTLASQPGAPFVEAAVERKAQPLVSDLGDERRKQRNKRLALLAAIILYEQG